MRGEAEQEGKEKDGAEKMGMRERERKKVPQKGGASEVEGSKRSLRKWYRNISRHLPKLDHARRPDVIKGMGWRLSDNTSASHLPL